MEGFHLKNKKNYVLKLIFIYNLIEVRKRQMIVYIKDFEPGGTGQGAAGGDGEVGHNNRSLALLQVGVKGMCSGDVCPLHSIGLFFFQGSIDQLNLQPNIA